PTPPLFPYTTLFRSWNAPRMGDAHDVLHRRHRAEHVRHVRDGDDLRPLGEQLLELVEEEVALLVHRRPLDDGAAALAVEMPGHEDRKSTRLNSSHVK